MELNRIIMETTLSIKQQDIVESQKNILLDSMIQSSISSGLGALTLRNQLRRLSGEKNV